MSESILGIFPAEPVKAPCASATFTQTTLAGLQGYAPGARILVNGQDDARENGIYNAQAGAWTRASDFNDPQDVADGQVVLVLDTLVIWQVSISGGFSPGSSEVAFLYLTESEITPQTIEAAGAVMRSAEDARPWEFVSIVANFAVDPHKVPTRLAVQELFEKTAGAAVLRSATDARPWGFVDDRANLTLEPHKLATRKAVRDFITFLGGLPEEGGSTSVPVSDDPDFNNDPLHLARREVIKAFVESYPIVVTDEVIISVLEQMLLEGDSLLIERFTETIIQSLTETLAPADGILTPEAEALQELLAELIADVFIAIFEGQNTVLADKLAESITNILVKAIEQNNSVVSEALANLIVDVLLDAVANNPALREALGDAIRQVLETVHIRFASITTDTFFRGKVVDLVPDEFGNVTVDWAAATVFRLDTLSTPAAEIYMTMANMPVAVEDEEQTIYVDLRNAGNKSIVVDSAYTLEFPDITTRINEGVPPLTVDGRDYILAASNNGVTITTVFIYDIGPDPSHPSSQE